MWGFMRCGDIRVVIWRTSFVISLLGAAYEWVTRLFAFKGVADF